MKGKKKIAKKNMGGSMGGGMNPMGRSPDPTVKSITGYNPTMRKKVEQLNAEVVVLLNVEWE